MLNEKVEAALNEQINREVFSAYLYFSMASYFDSIGLAGASHWMRMQTMEELAHVAKFTSFISDRRGRVRLTEIAIPQAEWDSPLAAFESAFEHEVAISGAINRLLDVALEHSDHATANFLQWFVAEQVEEEASANEVWQKVKRAGDGAGLFMVDQEMGARVFTPPAPSE